MLTINPIKLITFNKKHISFGETQKHNNNKVGLMSLEKNQNAKKSQCQNDLRIVFSHKKKENLIKEAIP